MRNGGRHWEHDGCKKGPTYGDEEVNGFEDNGDGHHRLLLLLWILRGGAGVDK